MLMLTHTYLLQKFLESAGIGNYDHDVFVYNIIPDLLTIHPNINSRQTHKIKRLYNIPRNRHKAAYIMFHLLVDDLAHYGLICQDIPDDFNPNSQGYSYIKGRSLINSLLIFQKEIDKEISYNEAVYRSHLIVEMVYDLTIADHIYRNGIIDILTDSIGKTSGKNMDEFVTTIQWVYGLGKREILEVMDKACAYVTKDRIQKIMNIEGRIHLYANKFGLQLNEELMVSSGIKDIFHLARQLLEDNEVFLTETQKAVKRHGWQPPIT